MVEYIKAMFALYGSDENEGQGLVEYALIIVLVAVVVIGLLTAMGGAVGQVFTDITAAL